MEQPSCVYGNISMVTYYKTQAQDFDHYLEKKVIEHEEIKLSNTSTSLELQQWYLRTGMNHVEISKFYLIIY